MLLPSPTSLHSAAAPSALGGAQCRSSRPPPVRSMQRISAAAATVPVGLDELRTAMWRALKASGHNDEDATTLLDVRLPQLAAAPRPAHATSEQVILYAQLRDNSQGVIKITTGAAARDAHAASIVTEHETKLSGAWPA